MNKVLLIKNTFEKMRNSDRVRQERHLDVNMTFLLLSWSNTNNDPFCAN